MPTSSRWKVYVESSPDGCGDFFQLECGDITTLNNGACGRNVPVFDRDYVHGFMVETTQVQEAPNNSATLQVPESEADHLKNLYRRNCLTHMQRRNCKTDRVQHFHDMILNGETLSRPTANGVNVQEGFPVVSMPVRYRQMTEFDAKSTVTIATTTRPTDTILTDVVTCHCDNCFDSKTLWRVWSDEAGGNSFTEYSEDDGVTWVSSLNEIPDDVGGNNNAYALHCFHGRIFITSTNGFNWNIDPTCKPWFNDSRVNNINGVFGTPFAMASEGLKLFALSRFDLVNLILKFNVTNGNLISPLTGQRTTWSSVDATTVVYNDIAVHRDTVIVVGNDGVYRYSTESGDPVTWRSYVLPDGQDIMKVVLFGQDSVKSHEAVAIVATTDNKIYKIKLPRTGETAPYRYGTLPTLPSFGRYTCEEPTVIELKDFCTLADTGSDISLFSILGGRGYWWGRPIDGTYYYLFNSGDTCDTIQTVDSSISFPDDAKLVVRSTSKAIINY